MDEFDYKIWRYNEAKRTGRLDELYPVIAYTKDLN